MKNHVILASLIILFSVSTAKAACREYREISRQASTVSRDLFDLRFEVRTSFPNSWSLYDLIQRAELDASFLNRTSRSGSHALLADKINLQQA